MRTKDGSIVTGTLVVTPELNELFKNVASAVCVALDMGGGSEEEDACVDDAWDALVDALQGDDPPPIQCPLPLDVSDTNSQEQRA